MEKVSGRGVGLGHEHIVPTFRAQIHTVPMGLVGLLKHRSTGLGVDTRQLRLAQQQSLVRSIQGTPYQISNLTVP